MINTLNNTATLPTSGKVIEIAYNPQDYQREIHDHPARFRVVKIGRRGGKTEFLIQEGVRLSVSIPGLHWLVAPTYRQVKSILWTRLKAVLRVDPDWKYNEQELSAEHSKIGTRLELKGADNEDNLRGVGLKSCGLDECAMIKPNVWPEIIRPMLADSQGPATFISTPKGRNWFYDLYQKGVGNDPQWKSWSYPTSINKFIQSDEIEQARRDMSERLFKQEFLAEFLDDDTSVFKGVRPCVVGSLCDPIPGRYYVMGVDLAKTLDYTCLVVIDGVTREVVAFERFQDVKWSDQKIRIQKLAHRYNNAMCVIDASGVGDPIVEDLSNANISLYYNDDGKPGFKFTSDTKTQLIEQLAMAIEQRQITFPRIEVLIEELMSYEYEISDGGHIKYGAPQGKHDDCVTALALAVWGIRHQLHEAAVVIHRNNKPDSDRQGYGEIIHPDAELETQYAGY